MSSPLPPIDAGEEKSTAPSSSPPPHETRNPNTTTNGVSSEDATVHSGPSHYDQPTNHILDPRVQREIDAMGTYQAGPDAEAGQSVSRL